MAVYMNFLIDGEDYDLEELGPEAMQLGQRFAELQAELEKISTRESEIRILQNTYALHIKNMANPDPKIEVVQ
tara:strand:+ start:1752 stop:1970 length:219 start_codon:yes stop_codon:yes gene_type:complete